MFKKFLALVMCLVIMCGMGISANAQSTSTADELIATVSESGENQVQPCYDYTNIISASIRNSNGKAVCTGDVSGYSGITTKIVLTMTLQKKSLLWWSKVQEWTTTSTAYYATLVKTVAVDSGKYRVKVEAVVYSGSNSETVSCTSQTYEF